MRGGERRGGEGISVRMMTYIMADLHYSKILPFFQPLPPTDFGSQKSTSPLKMHRNLKTLPLHILMIKQTIISKIGVFLKWLQHI